MNETINDIIKEELTMNDMVAKVKAKASLNNIALGSKSVKVKEILLVTKQTPTEAT